jgi:hypothetical protein
VNTPPDRLLIVDEGLDARLASQLEGRGRRAMSTDRLGLKKLKDEPLLQALARLPETAPILVTTDDAMPGEHEKLLDKLGLTVATIDGRRKPGWPPEEWKRETIHRWAHVIQVQEPGTCRRYSPAGHDLWRERRRPT